MTEAKLATAEERRAVLERIAAERRIPRATYRLQLNSGFTFADATAIVPYLDDLGISDVYVSPIFLARPGSTHGYDVCDHGKINPELGGEKGFNALVTALHERGMGLVVDMVPNHMAINHPTNRWWMDVLENGPASIHASFFDINWHPIKAELAGKVLLPILGDQYGAILDRGELKVKYADGAFMIQYWDTALPVAPRSYEQILTRRLDEVIQDLGEDNPETQELQSILTAIRHLPPRAELAPDQEAERNREKEVIKRRIAALYASSKRVAAAVDDGVQDYNDPSDTHSLDLLDELLSDQAHRLAFWRVAAEEINYRRFFDINDMAAIRVERPEVFDATHNLLLDLMAEGKITGVRIDHPDGLWAPTVYFRSLQEQYLARRLRVLLRADDGKNGRSADEDTDEMLAARLTTDLERTPGLTQWPMYVVAEKILSERETLPREWAIDGTTGYDFLSSLNGIFVDIASAERIDRAYRQFTGVQTAFWNLTNSTKKMIMLVSLSSEINALSFQLERIAEKNRAYRDFTLNSLTFAIREIMACLPVYRTYYAGGAGQSASDESHIRTAAAEAKRRNPRTAAAVFDFIEDTLLLRNLQSFREEERPTVSDWVMKFQQVSSPVMAKGVEDTAFYVYTRLTSLNEVGGDPAQFGISLADFHKRNAQRLRRWPHSMLATTTHDTKRSEDVRARISVLSEIPTEWRAAFTHWSSLNSGKKVPIEGASSPDANDEYLLYQTLIGAWPAGKVIGKDLADFRDRIVAYMLKATKEAKLHTSWVNPNDQYDAAVEQFVRGILSDDPNDLFMTDLAQFVAGVSAVGYFNGLSQQLIKLTAPGVPDLYQGTELWSLSLVDPDNRRPVDFPQRQKLLASIQADLAGKGEDRSAYARSLLDSLDSGRAKLYTTCQTLAYRREHPELFGEGDYLPLRARGARRRQICAFARTEDGQAALIVAPRLLADMTEGGSRLPIGEAWQDTAVLLPAGLTATHFRDIFTGRRIAVEQAGTGRTLPLNSVLESFPLALLEAEPMRARRRRP